MAEIGRKRLPWSARIHLTEHQTPHLDQRARTLGRQIQSAKQFLPGRLYNALQVKEIVWRRIVSIGVGGDANLVGVGEKSRFRISRKALRPG